MSSWNRCCLYRLFPHVLLFPIVLNLCCNCIILNIFTALLFIIVVVTITIWKVFYFFLFYNCINICCYKHNYNCKMLVPYYNCNNNCWYIRNYNCYIVFSYYNCKNICMHNCNYQCQYNCKTHCNFLTQLGYLYCICQHQASLRPTITWNYTIL